METEPTVTLELTDDELARILMGLTLARNSPQMTGANDIDDLIAKFAAHVDTAAVPTGSTCTDDGDD